MSRAWFALAVTAVLGLFYVGAGLQSGPPAGVAFGQPVPMPEAMQVGRYQIAVSSGTAERSGVTVVCDTTTGQCWQSTLSSVLTGGRSTGDTGGVPWRISGRYFSTRGLAQ